MKTYTFSLYRDCPHCGTVLPMNGPLRSVWCEACSETIKLNNEKWLRQVREVANTEAPYQMAYKCSTSRKEGPQCRKCLEHVPVNLDLVGEDTSIPCPACRFPMATFPAPPWLRKYLPSVVQVFASERESSEQVCATAACPSCGAVINLTRGADPIVSCPHCSRDVYFPDRVWDPPEAGARSARSVVMACPHCSGSVEITTDTHRLSMCSNCGKPVFVEERLWKRLRPGAVARAWTIVYDADKVEDRDDLRKRTESLVGADCPTCGGSTRFLTAYNRTWCDSCQKYL